MIAENAIWRHYFDLPASRSDPRRSHPDEKWVDFISTFAVQTDNAILYLTLDVVGEIHTSVVARTNLRDTRPFSFFSQTAPSNPKRFGTNMVQARANLRLLKDEEYLGTPIRSTLEYRWRLGFPFALESRIELDAFWEFIVNNNKRAEDMQVMAATPRPPELMIILADLLQPLEVWRNCALQATIAYTRIFRVSQLLIIKRHMSH